MGSPCSTCTRRVTGPLVDPDPEVGPDPEVHPAIARTDAKRNAPSAVTPRARELDVKTVIFACLSKVVLRTTIQTSDLLSVNHGLSAEFCSYRRQTTDVSGLCARFRALCPAELLDHPTNSFDVQATAVKQGNEMRLPRRTRFDE
jgi:hypothetical protein